MWESISLRPSGSVEIQGHAVAEAPTGMARALLYIARGSPPFLLHQSYKSFYHIFRQFDHISRGQMRRPIYQLGTEPEKEES